MSTDFKTLEHVPTGTGLGDLKFVAEGLLRCRIARADHVLAIVPALEVARLQRAGVTTEVYANLPPVFDSDYGLCTLLAPVWLPSPLLDSLAHELAAYEGQAGAETESDEVVSALARLYRQAVLQALRRPLPEPIPEPPPDHRGVALQSVDHRGVFLQIVHRQVDQMHSLANVVVEGLPGFDDVVEHLGALRVVLDGAGVRSGQHQAGQLQPPPVPEVDLHAGLVQAALQPQEPLHERPEPLEPVPA